jgi:undecaprenyl diphosphate synthase
MQLKDAIDRKRLPSHVAIIMDGNGRWAQHRNLDRVFGHREGVNAVRNVIEAAAEIQIGYLTLYAFSTENWGRPDDEVMALMGIMVQSLSVETETLLKNNIRLTAIGDMSRLADDVRERLFETLKLTSACTGMTLVIALSYSSRWEITAAAKQIAIEARNGLINTDNIDEQYFEKHLTTKDLPDPELLIRTSGELRISNFLLWQLAYTEFYFTETLWPDFGKDEFYKALIDYQKRERRFGKTSEQVSEKR